MATPSEINKRNAAFWARKQKELRSELEKNSQHLEDIKAAFAVSVIAHRANINPATDDAETVAEAVKQFDFVEALKGKRMRRQGEKQSKTQALRRANKPSTNDYDTARNERIRSKHQKLVAAGHTDATSQLAKEFEMSDRQIRRIVSGGHNPDMS